MSKLRIADNLTLPADAVTQAIGILAKRRAGKSYAARRFAEQLYAAGQQIVIVDPKGDWWGIRSSADGKSPGLPVVILGGERGDVPLEANAGEIVAKLVVEERVSVLLDLSLFRKHEVATFMTAFLENLYRLKAREIYRTPLMLIIDEADAIAPQKPQENEARMLGAAEDIVRRGGQRGIGCMMITQRSAVLNKNVLTQVEVLVALRTIAPQDLKAMDAWIEVHGEKAERDTLMSSLPSLPIGDAWFWSPGWPSKDGIFQRVHVLPIETFDSGATPKSGEKRVEPKNLADVDLASLTTQMSATIERAKADDPKLLRKRIAEQDKTIARLQSTVQSSPSPKTVVDQDAIDRAVNAERRRLHNGLRGVQHIITRMVEAAGKISLLAEQSLPWIAKELENKNATQPVASAAARQTSKTTGDKRVASTGGQIPRRAALESRQSSSSSSSLAKGEKTMLIAIAQYPEGAGRDQLTVLTGYKRSTRDAYIQRLGVAGFVEVDGSLVRATDAGIAALGSDYEPLPQGEELQSYWLGRLPEGEGKILGILLREYPDSCGRDYLTEETGYKRSTRDAYIQRLKSRRLVEDSGRGEVRPSPNLFDE